jgi:catechol 2,3-dioxygenase-like lactoylglutathione lyase family enzyme
VTLPARISVVTLGVSDLERSIAFYESLGWKRSPKSVEGEICWFSTVDSVLGLFRHAELAADAGIPADPPPRFRGVTLAINVESDEAVQTTMDAVEAAGATVVKPPQRAEWGGMSGYFADPDGHLWELVHTNFELTPEGKLDLG